MLVLHWFTLFICEWKLIYWEIIFFPTVTFPVSKNDRVISLLPTLKASYFKRSSVISSQKAERTYRPSPMWQHFFNLWIHGLTKPAKRPRLCAFPLRKFLTRQREWKHEIPFSLWSISSAMRLGLFLWKSFVGGQWQQFIVQCPLQKGNIVMGHHHCQQILDVKEKEESLR